MMKAMSWITTGLFVWMLFLIEVAEPAPRAVKSIKAENGDVIDCINIYQQPAFNHPRLKNHKIIGVAPGNMSSSTRGKAVRQPWRKNGKCPDGTIAVRRATQHSRIETDATQPTPIPTNSCYIDYAGLETLQKSYGTRGYVDVWGIKVEPNEWSASGVVVSNGKGSRLQFGWMVSPTLYGDDGQTRLFIRTVDPPSGVDCFNLECSGFVQTTNEIAFGAVLTPLSQVGGDQFEDSLTNNWWVVFGGDTPLGYWPKELFPTFNNGSSRSYMGGEVCNRHPGERFTTSQMGSGAYITDGWGKCAFVDAMQLRHSDDTWEKARKVSGEFSRACYGVLIYNSQDGLTSAMYGGTGNEECCGNPCLK
uniref:Neprosin PEP catalytic domain-containing protein n=1 Tax=Leersia perrieri TaxID=77586 RepID=A0A0D9XQC7_9ORYZ